MSTTRTHTARLPLRLPDDLLARCRDHARARGEDLSAFARRALEQQIGRDHLVRRLADSRQAFRDGVWDDLRNRHPLKEDARA